MALAAIPPDADGGEVVFIESDELEAFVEDHHPHLAVDDYFHVIESAGDC